MSHQTATQKLLTDYETLTAEQKDKFVREHLARVLEHVSSDHSSQVLSAVSQVRKDSAGVRDLSLKRYKLELDALFRSLEKDTKCFFRKERSEREQLLEEILSSLNTWMNDVWNIVYDHHMRFIEAHECLLCMLEVAEKIIDIPMPPGQRCKCTLMTMPIYFEISRDSDGGNLIKKFALTGPLKLVKPIIWLWREIFLAFLAFDCELAEKTIPNMLKEIEHRLGWGHVERILYGGWPRRNDQNPDLPIPGFSLSPDGSDGWSDNDDAIDDDLTEGMVQDESDHTFYMQALHWSDEIEDKRPILWEIIKVFLMDVFAERPSYSLYMRLLELSQSEVVEEMLDEILDTVRGDTSDSCVAALTIYTRESNSIGVAALLEEWPHLLRPQDDSVYQLAVSDCLRYDAEYNQLTLSIIEKELLDTVSAIYAKMCFHFPGISDRRTLDELQKYLKIREGSSDRKSKIEQWVQQVRYVAPTGDNDPANGANNPFALAAMMMGLPPLQGSIGGGEAEEEMLHLLDQDDFQAQDVGLLADPDLAELKEEFRPKLKARFEGWHKVAVAMKADGQAILVRVYKCIVEKMPFFKAPDVVEALFSEMPSYASRGFLCDAMQCLDSFCKKQRKRIKTAASKRQASKTFLPVTQPPLPAAPSSSSTSVNATVPPQEPSRHHDEDHPTLLGRASLVPPVPSISAPPLPFTFSPSGGDASPPTSGSSNSGPLPTSSTRGEVVQPDPTVFSFTFQPDTTTVVDETGGLNEVN